MHAHGPCDVPTPRWSAPRVGGSCRSPGSVGVRCPFPSSRQRTPGPACARAGAGGSGSLSCSLRRTSCLCLPVLLFGFFRTYGVRALVFLPVACCETELLLRGRFPSLLHIPIQEDDAGPIETEQLTGQGLRIDDANLPQARGAMAFLNQPTTQLVSRHLQRQDCATKLTR